MAEKKTEKKRPKVMNFVFGGLAGMGATCIVQPMDLVKNRMQMSGAGKKAKEFNSTMDVIKHVVKNEGVFAFYNGLSAGLLRQVTYTTARMGIYSWLFDFYSKEGHPPSFALKAGMGMVSGMLGAFVGTPAEVALIRMTSDGRLPPAERRNYKNAIHAWYRIVLDEGVTTLWRGAVPTMARAMVVNAAQLATYSQAKQFFLSRHLFNDNLACHTAAAFTSGFVTTVFSMPVDIAKTRLQNMKTAPGGTPEYSGFFDVFAKVLKNEGPLAFWKGFTAYFFRVGPHTVFTFIFLEQFNNAYDKFVIGEKTRSI